MKFKGKKKYLLFIVLPVVLASGVFYFFFYNQQTADAAWWNEQWLYRKKSAVSNSGSSATNQYVKITLDTASLITAGKMQSDCDDLRVTDYHGEVLTYFIDGDSAYTCNDSDTAIYAMVPSIPDSGADVYLYYGNASAESGEAVTGSAGKPGLSCRTIVDHGDTHISSQYFITPSGNLADTIEVECDMSYDGGGWTKVYEGLATTASKVSYTTGKEVEISNSELTFNEMRISAVNWDYSSTRTTSETATMQSTFSEYFEWLFAQNDATSPQIKFYAEADGLQDVGFTVGGDLLHGYGNSWRRVLPRFYVYDGEDDYMYLGNLSGTNIDYEDWYDYGGGGDARYNTQMNRTTPEESGLGLTPFEFQMIKTWIRADDINLDINQSAGSPGSEEKGQGPVGWWSFDEGYGATAYDGSSNGNDGSIAGATWKDSSQCVSDNCLYFDGTDDTVNVSNLNYPATWDDAFSISTWIYIPSSATWTNGYLGTIIAKGSYGGSYGLVRGTTDNQVGMWVRGDNGNIVVYGSVTRNKWHYLTGTWDGTNVGLYIDGKLINESGSTRTGVPDTGTLYVGQATAFSGDIGNWFNGRIDESKIYPYARSIAQIKADYNAGMSGASSVAGVSAGFGGESDQFMTEGLVGHWKMDESSWNGTGGEVVDASGNGRHATSTNASVTAGKYGNGGDFNGTTAYIRSGADYSDLGTSNQEYTMAVWVKADSGETDGNIVHMSSAEAGTGWCLPPLSLDGSKFTATSWDGAQVEAQSSTSITTDRWYYVVTTWDAERGLRLYVDGELDTATGQSTYSASGSSNYLHLGFSPVGCSNDQGYFDGKMDDFRVYTRSLDAQEVRQLYEFAPGPVGHWKMDEKTGSTAYDTSGNSYDLSFTNSPSWKAGKYGSSLDFDNDDYVTDDWTDFSLVNQTIEFWMKADTVNTSWRDMVGTTNNTDSNRFHLASTDNSIMWYHYVGGTSNLDSDVIPVAGQWYHVAGTYDGTTAKIYINGVLKKSTTDSISSYTATGLWVGGTTEDFDGQIDDLKIYNYARTSKQVVEDMNGGHPAGGSPVGSQQGYWKFDEGYETTAFDSGYGDNDGTIYGASYTNDGKFGKALSFDGVNDYVNFGTGEDFFPLPSFSVSVWFKSEGTTPTTGTSPGLFGFTYGIRGLVAANYLSFGVDNGSSFTYLNSPSNYDFYNDDTWHHMVGTATSDTLKLYVDGILVNSTPITWSGTTRWPTNSWNIGRDNNDGFYFFTGQIDEFQLFSSALTQDEVRVLYNNGASALFGATGTESDGTVSYSADRGYCPPGDTTSACGPLAEWKMDEKTGSTAYDTSASSYDGTLTGGTWARGKIGSATDFDGSDDFASYTRFSLGTGGHTMSAWVKTTSSDATKNYAGNAAQNILGDHTTGVGVGFGLTGGKIQYNHYTGAWYAVTGSTDVNDGEWHYIAATHNTDGTVNLYLDGVLDGTGSITFSSNRYLDRLGGGYLNGTGAGDLFDGTIDHVRVFNYSMDAAQIAWDYNKGKPVAHWKFDECAGSTIDDWSGNGYTGTLSIGGSGTQDAAGTCSSGDSTDAWYNGASGKRNYSLSFDGTDDYVDTNMQLSAASVQNGGNSYSAWIKTSSGVSDAIVGHSTSASYSLYNCGGLHLNSSSKAEMVVYNGSAYIYATGDDALNDGQWHHVVGVHDAVTDYLYIYVDGMLQDSTDMTQGILCGSMLDAEIGRRHKDTDPAYFPGQLDDIQIYNYPLSEQQVRNVYNQGAVYFGPLESAP